MKVKYRGMCGVNGERMEAWKWGMIGVVGGGGRGEMEWGEPMTLYVSGEDIEGGGTLMMGNPANLRGSGEVVVVTVGVVIVVGMIEVQ